MGFPDKHLAEKSIARDDHDNPLYNPHQPITTTHELNQSSKDLAVIFPPWHNGRLPIKHLASRLATVGWRVLLPEFAGQILKPDVEQVQTAFSAIAEQMAERITSIQDEGGIERTLLVGASLGGVSLAMTAPEIKFNAAHFVASGSNLAGFTWGGIRTREIAKTLEGQGVTYDELADAWHDLAPMTHTAAFEGKAVGMVISDADDIIPTPYQNELSRTLKDHTNVDPRHSLFGHYLSIGLYCMRGDLPKPDSILA